MTRGNQREIDRMRAANRHAGKGTPKEGDPLKRNQDDANALAAKVAAKKAAAEKAEADAKAAAEWAATGGAGGGTTGDGKAAAAAVVVDKPKKVAKPKEDLSFLDSAVGQMKKK